MALDTAGLGLRIAEARQRAGLKQEDLARAGGIDRSVLAKIETGARRVTALELARLAQAIGERIEWFVDEPVDAIVSHRNVSDPGEPSPRIDEAIDRITRSVEFVAAHDKGLRSSLQAFPAQPEPADSSDAEASAERAHELLGIDRQQPIYSLSAKLASAGVLTFVVDVGSESADAGSVLLAKGAVALVNGTLRTGRRRLALAHELGHVLVADEYNVDWRIDSTTGDDRERALDRFARAFLLPRAALAERWSEWVGEDGGRMREAGVRAASVFRVDMSTLARRLLELDLVDSRAAAYLRTIKTGRADIVEHDLVVADELAPGELPREYEAAVLRLFTSEIVSDVRALDLLLDTWDAADLPQLARRDEAEIWQFAS